MGVTQRLGRVGGASRAGEEGQRRRLRVLGPIRPAWGVCRRLGHQGEWERCPNRSLTGRV